MPSIVPVTLLSLVQVVTPAEVPHEQQIHWQRSLDDALALSLAEDRPLLIAINADGESGSERIVRERYRDPEFVHSTRSFVCVVGSVFRHSPRDRDDHGRRIPCPRLGAVTCGEHQAMEPAVYERYQKGTEILLDGEPVERISPRHSIVSPAGEKQLDLFLLFDMAELDDALAEAAAGVGGTYSWSPAVDLRGQARDPDFRGRELFELAARGGHPWAVADALLHAGGPASVDALRMLWERALELELPALQRRLDYVTRVLGLESEVALALRQRALSLDDPRFDLLAPALALDPEGLGARTRQQSLRVMDGDRLRELLDRARSTRGDVPPPAPPEERATQAELEARLAELEPRARAQPDDAPLSAELGRAFLQLARLRIEGGDSGAGFLLEDAARLLDAAAETLTDDVQLRLDRARTSYHLSDFEAQERHALAAMALTEPGSDMHTEAQRWVGDACARLVAQRAVGDRGEELAGIRRGLDALVGAAFGPESDATDWLSLASFCGAIGRPIAALELAREGLARTPESDPLRAYVTGTLRNFGRPEKLSAEYEALAAAHPDSGACAWYAGWALVNQAEWHRVGEDPQGALATYRRADEHFRSALALRPDFEDSANHYLALSAMGRGFAELLADHRTHAAEFLVEAITIRPAIASVRDGLDREALDLLDASLEWRRSGPSTVDAAELARRLGEADPGNSFWARSISDSELREGMRAFGRNRRPEAVAYLELALDLARIARGIEDTEETRRALSQSATVLAEMELQGEGAPGRAAELLAQAAPPMGLEPPAEGADSAALEALAAELRGLLGQARPVAREGR